MLELKHIKKDYPAGNGVVHALKGIDLQFRKAEFVSILGPSGCGKTTMLNIIGGLDGYTEGDLVINGVSTREYKDREWDSYRNHSVGFVFQSYNLIPHQTVLQNVELALTLSGVSKSERRSRARAALEQVGLAEHLHKRPNTLSGGQMQRVAIARALVNNPDIILADEPTGALDTETSVQVMEILKEISKDRLIIMVTHNPDLAERYSSRIIRMLDGVITADSQPLSEAERQAARQDDQTALAAKGKAPKKPTMSFGTSFMLSLKNLFTKKGRTALTAFAGSIGIIGIALILSVSQGMTTYINTVQEETLSAYPLTLEASTIDLSTLISSFMDVVSSDSENEDGAVYERQALYDMINALNNLEESENDLTSFQAYLEEQLADEDSELAQAVNGVQYTYDLDLLVYTQNVDGDIIRSDTTEVLQSLLAAYMDIDVSAMTDGSSSSSILSSMTSMSSMSSTALWQELLAGEDGALINELVLNQYELVYGSWPSSYNEVVLVLDENNELDDVTLYALGLLSQEDMDALASAAADGTVLDREMSSWTYEEICELDYHVILNADCYVYDEATGLYDDLRDTDAGLRYLYDNAMTLEVVGIIRPGEDSTAAMLSSGIAYTTALTEYLSDKADGSEAIAAQMDDPDTDILTGLPFAASSDSLDEEEKEAAFREIVAGMTQEERAELYISIASLLSDEELEAQTQAALASMTREDMEAAMAESMAEQMSMDSDSIYEYLAAMSDEELNEVFSEAISEQIAAQYAAQVAEQLSAMSVEQLAAALDAALEGYTTEQCALYYDQVLEFSSSTYEDNLVAMGYFQLDDPAAINIYASTFENKDIITDAIDAYNDTVDEMQEIQYTDYLGLMMSSITTIINAIAYVLIAFVAISLVVSSIMIGVITLISVQERTKEIGILRAIGASKKDVSSMFTAETMIVGLTAGLLGVVVTALLCLPINAILHSVTGIGNLSAILPLGGAVILVAISTVLTLIAGIIPSRSAAKKDPVVALRTE
ncbi:MAG: ABC transporter ATP-binding protein/permease [Oscillospiraceae bacterium]|nr:ABC transporter ATP-binding protein/permease [Oscillospiraceae bacterium]